MYMYIYIHIRHNNNHFISDNPPTHFISIAGGLGIQRHRNPLLVAGFLAEPRYEK